MTGHEKPVRYIVQKYSMTGDGQYMRGNLTAQFGDGTTVPVDSASEYGENPGTGNYEIQRGRGLGAARNEGIAYAEIDLDLMQRAIDAKQGS